MRPGALLLLCVGAVSGAATAAPAPLELPPLMQPAVAEHPGKVIWAELVTPDLAAAERFYGGLFGWTFHDMRTSHTVYAVARLGNAPIAGLVQRPPRAGAQSAWLPFLSVSSVHEVGRLVVAKGGTELTSPHAYRMRGQQAIYADPQGAVFAVLNSHSGDPPDVLAAPGEWIWSVLMARDPASDAAFYQDVFGYEVFELPSDARGEHLLLTSEQYARASVNPLPGADHRQPHWTEFVRVIDVARAAELARGLGGRVLVEPHPDRHGDTVALLADPAGAAIGVMEWNAAPGASP